MLKVLLQLPFFPSVCSEVDVALEYLNSSIVSVDSVYCLRGLLQNPASS